MSAPSPTPSNNSADDCSICLNALATGATLLTLACNHKFHLDCLASNVKASNNQCPLCRVALDASLIQMLTGNHGTAAPATIQLPVVLAIAPPTATPVSFCRDIVVDFSIEIVTKPHDILSCRLYLQSKIRLMKKLHEHSLLESHLLDKLPSHQT